NSTAAKVQVAKPKLDLSAALAQATGKIQAAPKEKEKAQVIETVQDKRFEKIQENTFFKIAFDPATKDDPEAKRNAIVKARTPTAESTKEQLRAIAEEYELFKEYLQAELKTMHVELMGATDVESFAELHGVYKDLDGALRE